MSTEATNLGKETAAIARPLPKRPTRTRSERRFVIGFWCVVTALGAAFVARLLAASMYPMPLSSALLSVIGVSMPVALVYVAGRQLIGSRFLRPHGGFVCPRCHYPLGHLPDFGNCPECGTQYTRTDVVELWEQWYGIRRKFARVSPLSARELAERRAAGLAALRPVRTGLPWEGARLQSALEQLQEAARRSGYAGGRFPAYLLELEHTPAARTRPIPPDLYGLFGWIDPHMWSWIVNPSRAVRGTGGGTPEDEWSTGGAFAAGLASEMLADPLILRRPELFRLRPESSSKKIALDAWARATAEQREVDDPAPIEFADASGGAIIVYCLGHAAFKDGTIIAVMPTGQSVWLASSLSEWLCRMAICGGAEPSLDENLADRVPAEFRAGFARRFREHNTGRSEFDSLV